MERLRLRNELVTDLNACDTIDLQKIGFEKEVTRLQNVQSTTSQVPKKIETPGSTIPHLVGEQFQFKP